MKIKRRYAGLVSGLLISLCLSLSISFVLNMLNKTPWNEFVYSWIKSSFTGFSIGYPLGRIFVPLMLNIVEKRIED